MEAAHLTGDAIMARKAAEIVLNQEEQDILNDIIRSRTEEDFAENIDAVVATDPEAAWIFVSDNLNTHMSATLVYLIALSCHISFESLGEKGKSGILKNKASRKRFLEDESHRIRFVYTPKHCSWPNQIENWFSGLSRRVLNRGSFASVDELNARILGYIEFYNATANPMNWTFDGTCNNTKPV